MRLKQGGSTETYTQVATRIPERVHAALKVFCAQSGRKMQDVIAEAVEGYVKTQRASRRAA